MLGNQAYGPTPRQPPDGNPRTASGVVDCIGNPGLGGSTVRLVLSLLVAVTLSACGAPTTPSPSESARLSLGVSNGTTLDVTLFVNGQRIADYPAGGPVPTIDPYWLPLIPWDVEVRSPSGRVLTSMHVLMGDVLDFGPYRTNAEWTIPMGRVDLSCGRLTVWAGDHQPSAPPPPPSPGRPGDCAP